MSARPPATSPPSTDGLALARRVLETEAAAILGLVATLDHRFERVVELLLGCRGRVIVTGIGKSGIICRKVAATLASTGTPAFFLHPAEAVHGDLGVIHAEDVVIALSHSGETHEVLRVVEAIKRIGATLVALTGHAGVDARPGRRRRPRHARQRGSLPAEPGPDREHHRRARPRRRAGDDAAGPPRLPRGGLRAPASARRARQGADAGARTDARRRGHAAGRARTP